MRYPRISRRSLWSLLVTLSLTAAVVALRDRPTVGVQRDGSIVVPNGQRLSPPGTHIEVNDRPLGMVLSPNHRLLAVVTGSNFNPRALHLIDVATRSIRQTVGIANSFVGVAFSPAGNRIYVGGGASNDVKLFSQASDAPLRPLDRFRSRAQRRVAYRSARMVRVSTSL